ncbi:MAG: hemolysin family protein [Acidimicrobiia bacterium]|nr:hemolysin family protein [Acidimicrobiia bacterium]
MITRIVVSILLLVLNAFFVAAEFALVAARRSQLEPRAEAGSRSARAVLTLQKRLSYSLTGAQLGVTVCSLGLGIVAEPLLSDALVHLFGLGWVPAAVSHVLAFALSLAIVTFLHMTLSEMVPKNLAIAEPVRTAVGVGLAFRAYVALFRWVIVVLNGAANAGTRLLGVEPPTEGLDAHTADDLALLLEESRERGLVDVDNVGHRVLSGALDFGRLDAAAVMVPRPDVAALDVTAPAADFVKLVRARGLSRIPVYEGDLDHMAGFVHAKDLFDDDVEAAQDSALDRNLVREMLVVPENARIDRLLVDMRNRRVQLALVVDEYGGTAGIVTIEDLLEELVGEIRDEYDRRERLVRADGPGAWVCDGRTRPDEFTLATGLSVPAGDYETLAGFVFDRLGRIPAVGDSFTFDGVRFEVRTMDGHRVAEVVVRVDRG